ncbi:MAG: transporter substrate-binding domain-containing protein [Acidisphaera sp.]|nr:transporter substrate-binding domain-containing protein [Acidisphaera sp.]MBV9813188.1 transporter substrate-binding domain-containing protein [Acetobacteraceae bacterium]
MKAAAPLLAFLALAGVATPGRTAGIAERLRAEHVLRCGATERPGIAEALPDDSIGGIAVDLCKAVAVAVLGPEGTVAFSLYDAPKSFDAMRSGEDALAFLTGREIAASALGGAIIPGPTVAIDPVAVMAHDAAPLHTLADLAGHTLCLMAGSRAQSALESTLARRAVQPVRLVFQEDVEMLDAYNAGPCEAVVGELTYLADMRRNAGVNRTVSRLLPEALDPDPIVAVTPVSDGAWAASVRAVLDALLLADAPADAWHPGGAAALPVPAPPGLRPGWREEVLAKTGSYAAIVRRDWTVNLGLPPGPNALWPAGALLPLAVR